jgi:hypothetical protein
MLDEESLDENVENWMTKFLKMIRYIALHFPALLRVKDKYGLYPWQCFQILDVFFPKNVGYMEKRTFRIKKYAPLSTYLNPVKKPWLAWRNIIFAAQLPTLHNEISDAIAANFEDIGKLKNELIEETKELESQEKERRSRLEQGIPVDKLDKYREGITADNFRNFPFHSKIERQLVLVLQHRAWLEDANRECSELAEYKKYIENLKEVY